MTKHNMTMTLLTRTSVLLALALVFQIGFTQFAQPAVGPLVNMTLLIAAVVVGSFPAIVIGCLTPLMAFVLGIMPLFPLVPFIMIGNILLILSFNLTRRAFSKYGEIIGVIVAALLKFAFLAISIRYLVTFFIEKVPPKIVVAFTLPQLYTALIGGLLAIVIVKYLSSYLKLDKKLNK
jgi:predicted membrane protein